jgi:hypothetical protein
LLGWPVVHCTNPCTWRPLEIEDSATPPACGDMHCSPGTVTGS